jgi:hypothetical protein
MDELRIRCYNQKTDQVRMIKKSIVDSGNAKAQGYEPQPEPEQLISVAVDVSPNGPSTAKPNEAIPTKKTKPQK